MEGERNTAPRATAREAAQNSGSVSGQHATLCAKVWEGGREEGWARGPEPEPGHTPKNEASIQEPGQMS